MGVMPARSISRCCTCSLRLRPESSRGHLKQSIKDLQCSALQRGHSFSFYNGILIHSSWHATKVNCVCGLLLSRTSSCWEAFCTVCSLIALCWTEMELQLWKQTGIVVSVDQGCKVNQRGLTPKHTLGRRLNRILKLLNSKTTFLKL